MSRSGKPTQEVVIELSNGVKGIFTGRVIAWPGQCDGVNVVGVKFFVPKIRDKKEEPPTEAKKEEPRKESKKK